MATDVAIRAGDRAILVGGVIHCDLGCLVTVHGRDGDKWLVQIDGRSNYCFRRVGDDDLRVLEPPRVTSWPPISIPSDE
jgi:hypothetical protein